MCVIIEPVGNCLYYLYHCFFVNLSFYIKDSCNMCRFTLHEYLFIHTRTFIHIILDSSGSLTKHKPILATVGLKQI